ncbi:hypothetical protein FO519_009821 [Halicephalobus sp. NKZ332]|nr:hypothetical protein FO519_009821 [Halicephalobus sp. NKZ332]
MDNLKTVLTFITPNDSNVIDFSKKRFDRFIFSMGSGGCIGIGNQMFRIASLYGIGLFPNVNRTPGLNGGCIKGYFKEFSETFPNVVKLVEFDDLRNKSVARTSFGKRMYENPEVIHDAKEKYLIINHGYLQAVRYFTYVMDEIRQLFDFHPKVKAQVEEYGNKLFISDNSSHKMCVHIRRGDFLRHRLLETEKEFLVPAMATKDDYFNIYRPKLRSRAEVMYFGVRYCDSLLKSASGSTFSTWIGLLMPEGKDIFYNRRMFKNRNEDIGKEYIDYERFPKHWNILELNASNKTVVIDNRWNFERYRKPNNRK